jgi:hypothetical protein
MNLHEITSPEIKNKSWEKFRAHHYTPDRWNPAARVFLATEVFDGKDVIVGMSAALAAPSGTTRNAWCSHKVVILPLGLHSSVWMSRERILLPDFDRIKMWRTLADTQAELFIKSGHPYFCNAGDCPTELIAYRENPASGWVPTSKHGKPPRDNGLHKLSDRPRATNAAGLVISYWYVGLHPSAPR